MMSREIEFQIDEAYRAMSERARYRPSAPGDGMGNVAVPEAELDVDDEIRAYVARWWREEDAGDYHVGCPDMSTRRALIYLIEAARMSCVPDVPRALKLAELAVAELLTFPLKP